MNTIEQRAREYAELKGGKHYRCLTYVHFDITNAYIQGAEDAMREPWIRWADRKPEDGTPIIAVTLNWNYGNPAYEHKYFGDMGKSVAEYVVGHNADNTYWLPLPKGKEDNSD